MISGYQLRDGSNGSANLRNSSNGTDSEGINTGRTSLPAWAVRNDNSIITAALDPDRFGPPTTLVLDSEDYSLPI